MTTRLSDFEGIWQMDRTIRHDDGTLAQAEGRAHLSPDGAGLTYHEAGQLRIAGMAPLTFERDYLWRQGAGRIDMMFADGASSTPSARTRPRRCTTAHPIPTACPMASTCREAGPAAGGSMGPRKGYVMETRYTR